VTCPVWPRRWPPVVIVSGLVIACAPSVPREAEAPAPAAAAKVEPAPLAEARLPDSPLALQITGVTRGGPEVLEVTFALVNPGATVAAPPSGPGRDAGTGEWLGAAYVTDEDRGTRFYVMRDAQGRPKCTAAPTEIEPGRREAMSARFPAPGTKDGRITVVVPGAASFRGIPFPGTAARGPSY